jgi:hypothetical protein
VERPESILNDSYFGFMKELSPFLYMEKQSNKWPGTITYGLPAKLYIFNCNEKARGIITKSTNGWSSWLHPDLPEDLSFFRKDKSVFLSCVTHEPLCRVYLNGKDNIQDFWDIAEWSQSAEDVFPGGKFF